MLQITAYCTLACNVLSVTKLDTLHQFTSICFHLKSLSDFFFKRPISHLWSSRVNRKHNRLSATSDSYCSSAIVHSTALWFHFRKSIFASLQTFKLKLYEWAEFQQIILLAQDQRNFQSEFSFVRWKRNWTHYRMRGILTDKNSLVEMKQSSKSTQWT